MPQALLPSRDSLLRLSLHDDDTRAKYYRGVGLFLQVMNTRTTRIIEKGALVQRSPR